MEFGIVELLLTVAFVATCVYGFKLFGGKDAPKSSVVVKKEAKKEDTNSGLLPMSIFYGSQSGTAEGLATDMAAEAKAYGFKAKVIDLEDYEAEDELASETFAVFLMATFGEGEPTDNAVQFYEWITAKDRENDEPLEELAFAVFALGNRQYEKFCNIGREVDAKLASFQAKRVCKHGEGDDDGCLEDDFEEWKRTFWPNARAQFGLPELAEVEAQAFEPAFKYEVVAEDVRAATGRYANYTTERALAQDPKNTPVFAPVTVSYELRQDVSDGGSTIHMDIDASKSARLRYLTADNLGVCPRNDHREAAQMMKRLGVNGNTLFTLRKPGKYMYPNPCTMLDAFLYVVDFNNVPKVGLLQKLALYANDAEKAALLNVARDKAAKEEFSADQKSLLEVLDEFRSINVPINHFLEFAPKLQPRYYTIASSSKVQPKEIGLCLSLLKEQKPRGRVHKGVATHHLCSLREGKDTVPVFVRPSSFRLPRKLNGIPIIMCGPGTGLAPFRGFVQEFMWYKEKHPSDTLDATLFFGCQRRDKDFLYKDELLAAEAAGVLKLHCAFSREQANKVYVQHLMEQNGEEIWDAIDKRGGYLYVCGATTMGKSIREIVVKLAREVGGMSAANAEKYLVDLQDKKRFVQELWG